MNRLYSNIPIWDSASVTNEWMNLKKGEYIAFIGGGGIGRFKSIRGAQRGIIRRLKASTDDRIASLKRSLREAERLRKELNEPRWLTKPKAKSPSRSEAV